MLVLLYTTKMSINIKCLIRNMNVEIIHPNQINKKINLKIHKILLKSISRMKKILYGIFITLSINVSMIVTSLKSTLRKAFVVSFSQFSCTSIKSSRRVTYLMKNTMRR